MSEYNIFTSCDDGLAPYLTAEIVSISESLPDDNVNFYLMHSCAAENSLKMLEELCASLGNISFRGIRVTDNSPFESWAKYGGGWRAEAYYPALAHLYLPESVDRALYIDAGDIVFNGGISEYYGCDFKGGLLTVHATAYKVSGNYLTVYRSGDMSDPNALARMLRGLFNSGSYMMNISGMRKRKLDRGYYDRYIGMLRPVGGAEMTDVFWGDQGFLSFTLADEINYFGFPEKHDPWYMPYNFCMWYYDRKTQAPDYHPAVVHYTGAFKPWTVSLGNSAERFIKADKKGKIHQAEELKAGQAEWYALWNRYALAADELLTKLGY